MDRLKGVSNTIINVYTYLIESIHKSFFNNRKGIEDTIVSMIPQFIALFIGFVTSIILARRLGPEEMGKYSLITSISGIIVVLSDLGISQTAIRYASRSSSQDNHQELYSVLRWAFRLRVIILFAIMIPIIIAIPFIVKNIWHTEGLSQLIYLSMIASVFTVLASVPLIFFKSTKRFKMNALVSTLQTIITFIGIFVIASLSQLSLLIVIIVSIISTGIGTFISMLLIPRESYIQNDSIKKPFTIKLKTILNVPEISESLLPEEKNANTFLYYMIIDSIIIALLTNSNIWVMGYYLNASQIGIYTIASYVAIPLSVIYSAFNMILWPRASLLKSVDENIQFLKTSVFFCSVVAIIGIIYSIFAPYFIPILFSIKYSAGIPTSQIICIGFCILIITCPIGIVGYNFGMIRQYWWMHLIELMIMLSINILLLDKIGIVASAIAFAASYLVGLIIQCALLYNNIQHKQGHCTN